MPPPIPVPAHPIDAPNGVPEVFCWTKMGTEAGQPLETILRRKELERKAGKGIFAWGIGNSLGSSPEFARQVAPGGSVDVLFSPMKSAPKPSDVAPSQVVLWLAYHSAVGGLIELPPHILVTSRGSLASGAEKRSHYALLCERQEAIGAETEHDLIDAVCARNLVSMNPLGASQVTAMVRYDRQAATSPEKPYPISFRAKMHNEGFVRLGCPALLSGELLAAYRALCTVSSVDDWQDGVAALKRIATASLKQHQPQRELFAS